jgi:hypothetical protein
MRDPSLQESQLLKVVASSVSVFNDAFKEDLNSIQLNRVRNIFADLKTVLKSYNLEGIAKSVSERPLCDISLTKGWMLNGVWNVFCTEQLESKFIFFIKSEHVDPSI